LTTVLDKELRRQITVDGIVYTVSLDPDGFRLIGKGKRKPEVRLQWRELLSGEAAMAVALNASLGTTRHTAEGESLPELASKGTSSKRSRKSPDA
jgi:hypothetical protein